MYETSSSLLIVDNASQPDVLVDPEGSNRNEFDNSDPFNLLYFAFLLFENLFLLPLVTFCLLIDFQHFPVQIDELCIRILQIFYLQQALRDLDFRISINAMPDCSIVLDKPLHLSRAKSIQNDPNTQLIDDVCIMVYLRSVSWISLLNWPSVMLKYST